MNGRKKGIAALTCRSAQKETDADPICPIGQADLDRVDLCGGPRDFPMYYSFHDLNLSPRVISAICVFFDELS